MTSLAVMTVAQVVERVFPCSEGWRLNPRPCHLCHSRRVLGQDNSPTVPRMNVSDCCMFEVVPCSFHLVMIDLMIIKDLAVK